MTPTDLRTWRLRAGLTQLELAAALGIASLTLSRWERGAQTIPPYLELALKGIGIEQWLEQHALPSHS